MDGGRLVDDRDEVDSSLDWDTEMGEDTSVEMVEERDSVDDDPVGPTELPVLVVALITAGSTDPGLKIDVKGPWRACRESRR